MAGSLEQVTTSTITSAVANISITGITTDDVYLLTYHNLFMTDDGRVPNIRFTKSSDSSADTSANYDQVFIQMYTNQSFYKAGNNNGTNFSNNSTGTTILESQVGMMYLYNFGNSSEYSFMTQEGLNITETPEYTSMTKGGVLTVAQSTNGVQFVANSGTIKSGTFTLYKINS